MLLEVVSRIGAVVVDGFSRGQPPRWVLQALLKLQAQTLMSVCAWLVCINDLYRKLKNRTCQC
jgi:hypothetical protein